MANGLVTTKVVSGNGSGLLNTVSTFLCAYPEVAVELPGFPQFIAYLAKYNPNLHLDSTLKEQGPKAAWEKFLAEVTHWGARQLRLARPLRKMVSDGVDQHKTQLLDDDLQENAMLRALIESYANYVKLRLAGNVKDPKDVFTNVQAIYNFFLQLYETYGSIDDLTAFWHTQGFQAYIGHINDHRAQLSDTELSLLCEQLGLNVAICKSSESSESTTIASDQFTLMPSEDPSLPVVYIVKLPNHSWELAVKPEEKDLFVQTPYRIITEEEIHSALNTAVTEIAHALSAAESIPQIDIETTLGEVISTTDEVRAKLIATGNYRERFTLFDTYRQQKNQLLESIAQQHRKTGSNCRDEAQEPEIPKPPTRLVK